MSESLKENDVASSGFEAYVTGIKDIEVEYRYTAYTWLQEEKKFIAHTCYYCDMLQRKAVIKQLYDRVDDKEYCEIGAVKIIMQHLATDDSIGETERVDQMNRLIYHLPLK